MKPSLVRRIAGDAARQREFCELRSGYWVRQGAGVTTIFEVSKPRRCRWSCLCVAFQVDAMVGEFDIADIAPERCHVVMGPQGINHALFGGRDRNDPDRIAVDRGLHSEDELDQSLVLAEHYAELFDFIDRAASWDGLRAVHAEGMLAGSMVTKEARAWLQASADER